MLTIRFDNSRFRAKVNAVINELAPAQERAVLLMGQQFTDVVNVQAPRDTNRYVRGWLMAANAAGAGRYVLPVLKRSHYYLVYKRRLERQMSQWSAVVDRERSVRDYWFNMYNNRYKRIGRDDRWARRAQVKLEAADKRLEKAMSIYVAAADALADLDETSIIIGGRYGLKGNRGDDAARRANDAVNEKKLRKSSLDTVRSVVYGGTGRLIRTGGGGHVTLVELINREPHTRIVESRHRVRARALAAVRRSGISRANAEMVKSIVRVFGMK